MDQTKIRQNAVRRYLAGESVTTICQDLGVSRKWFYKWYNRHQAGAENWYEDQSKAPKRCPHKINSAVEKLVLNIRDNLENTKYAQIGAMAIAWQIQKLGGTPPPLWSINRILKRNDRIKQKTERAKNKSNVNYPYFTEAFYPGHIHQADLVGPRYLKGDGRFYCFSTIDRFSHQAYSVPLRSKDDDSIIYALIKTWKVIGVPKLLQFDNELSFLGSNRYPHSFGKVLKLCLSVGIQPIFIPQGEPWRNGVIEHFNRTFESNFYRTEQFKNFKHLQEQLEVFLNYHNENHVYSANHGKTPNQILDSQEIKPSKLSDKFEFYQDQTLPYESYIHFVRFIRSDLKLRIRGESFLMPKETMYQYLRATIYTEYHKLNVFNENKLVAKLDYPLPNFNQENPVELIKTLAKLIDKFFKM